MREHRVELRRECKDVTIPLRESRGDPRLHVAERQLPRGSKRRPHRDLRHPILVAAAVKVKRLVVLARAVEIQARGGGFDAEGCLQPSNRRTEHRRCGLAVVARALALELDAQVPATVPVREVATLGELILEGVEEREVVVGAEEARKEEGVVWPELWHTPWGPHRRWCARDPQRGPPPPRPLPLRPAVLAEDVAALHKDTVRHGLYLAAPSTKRAPDAEDCWRRGGTPSSLAMACNFKAHRWAGERLAKVRRRQLGTAT
mmetsp:Transcript_62604/g.186571  ORF Transcript_62604/g.186571 Transcript_62604/m.186571 type:complete len:260 (+) Transcript_62604:252-1031(+)